MVVVVKKFVLIYSGYETPTPERAAAWNDWLRRRSTSLADLGNPFGPGRRITNDRVVELSLSSNPASGYSIVHAEHIDAAEQLLEGLPIAESVCLYEALPNKPQPTNGEEHP